MKRKTTPAQAKAKAKTSPKAKPKTPSHAPAAPDKIQAVSTASANSESSQILREIQALRALLTSNPAPARAADEALERGVDSMRRLLSELLEQQNQWILSRLIALRAAAAAAPKVAQGLEQLLDELGAIRFRAESFDHVDPRVHTVVEERPNASVSAGTILETLQPGFRSGNGVVLAKASVAVSRRD
jgi:molecular chaperone GrpE (heat shock protein)